MDNLLYTNSIDDNSGLQNEFGKYFDNANSILDNTNQGPQYNPNVDMTPDSGSTSISNLSQQSQHAQQAPQYNPHVDLSEPDIINQPPIVPLVQMPSQPTQETNDADANTLPELDDVFKLYFSHIKQTLFPDIGFKRYIILIVELFHILLALWILLGWMSPVTFIPYYIATCIFVLIMWEYMDDESLITTINSKISGRQNMQDLIPISATVSKITVICVLGLAIAGVVYPENSAFNLIKVAIAGLNKFN
ncbi:MAG: hypothetical protein Faunusvirus21_10 [Faunusvirus sp.]|uniref:Uncharacterized protein n=1 Tax=Faunusvirus sp. TaxID=2487766 RepID=A0A3G4ZXC2_9VIRU|nr:MAG: hypothetical protein Faunusvirus21_10 [Faunusvirus sp.]